MVGAVIGSVAGAIAGTVVQNVQSSGSGLGNLIANIQDSGFFAGLASTFSKPAQGKPSLTMDSPEKKRNMLIAGVAVLGLIVGLISIFKK